MSRLSDRMVLVQRDYLEDLVHESVRAPQRSTAIAPIQTAAPAILSTTSPPHPAPVDPASFPEVQAAQVTGRWSLGVALIGVVTAIVVGIFGLLDQDSNPPAAPVVNCTVEQQNVINLIEKNPGWQFTYAGPADEQCHLNDLVKSAPNPPS
ncbi:hypothetical protein G8767_25525 [Rhodococcus sp. IC4_135]|uniref:hypothetical protein n=1 Tax=Rhodococcus TaxID=1827 RepID=UPI00141E8501|nr:hypothetical protein [Rhodococcus sp. IC4_135]